MTALLFAAALLLPAAHAIGQLEVGKFSAAREGAALPEGWKPLTFPKVEKHTAYELVRDGEAVVVRARSEAAASGLAREIRIDPREPADALEHNIVGKRMLHVSSVVGLGAKSVADHRVWRGLRSVVKSRGELRVRAKPWLSQ